MSSHNPGIALAFRNAAEISVASSSARYGVAVLSVLIATLLRLLLVPLLGVTAVPFVTYFPAIVLSAWLGGFGPGLLSAALGAVLAAILFIPPFYSFAAPAPADLYALATYLATGLGITMLGETQRQAQAHTHAIQNSLAITLRSIGDAVIAVSLEDKIIFMNGAAEALTGWRQEEALGKSVREVYRTKEVAARQRNEQTFPNAQVSEAWLVAKNGEERFIEQTVSPIQDDAGQRNGAILVFRDVSERQRMSEALRESEERYRLTVENIRDFAIYTLDKDGYITSWNAGARRMKGYTPEETLGKRFYMFYPRADQEAGKPERALEQAMLTGRNEEENWRVRKDGSQFWGNEIMTAIRDRNGRLVGYVKISQDLTERKQAEGRRLRIEREATLLQERNRMAQDLHDTLAQGFTGARLQLEAARYALEQAPPEIESGLRHLARSQEIVQESHREALRSIRMLRAPLLDNNTLLEALRELMKQAPDATKVSLQVEGTAFTLPSYVENDLFRIVQEAFMNALRHSQASQITFTLDYSPDRIIVQIADDGVGFDAEKDADQTEADQEIYGMAGMQERAARLGASLQIESQPEQGTSVTLRLPLSLPD